MYKIKYFKIGVERLKSEIFNIFFFLSKFNRPTVTYSMTIDTLKIQNLPFNCFFFL